MTAVLIYSSDPKLDCGDWKDRFDRYAAAIVSPSQSFAVFVSSQTEGCLQWFREQAGHSTLILWDAAGRVPPKEIEALITRLEQTPLVLTTRYMTGSIGRGVSAWSQIRGRLLAGIRKIIKLSSDPRPPCMGICRDAVDPAFFKNLHKPIRDWPAAICREARRRQIPLLEIPVMWAA